MKKKKFNFNWGTITCQWNEAQSNEPAEVMIYDSIGMDPWSGQGISAADLKKALDEIPSDRDLNVRVNSRGGDVYEGMAMKNLLDEWPKKVTATIDGVAASTASWMILGADEIRAPKSSQMFIHDAIGMCFGNEAEMNSAASKLGKTSQQVAEMYADKTGLSADEMRQKMKAETLLTGEEAADLGLVDTLINNAKPVHNFTPRELATMSNRLNAIYNVAPKGTPTTATQTQTQPQPMNKKVIINLLKQHGVTEWDGKAITEETSNEHLEAALNQVLNQKKTETTQRNPQDSDDRVARLENQIAQLTEANNAAKTLRVTNAIDKLVTDDRLTVAERPAALKRALADDTYLNELQARPANRTGADPLTASRIELTGESFKDVQNYLLTNGPGFMRNFIGSRAEGTLGEKVLNEVKDRAIIVANTIGKHRKMLLEMFNTNTIDSGLQRQIILQEMLEEFVVVLAPLQSFSAVFNNVPLEGTDEVDVPFYPLATDGGNSWAAATGYASNLLGDTATNTRPVVVGGSGSNSGSSAPANTARDRKWVGAAFSSYELARQPYLNVQKLMVQKANRLAVLIFSDIISRVITNANYSAAVKAVPATAFSSADIADLWETATGRNWPNRGRSLVLNHKYKTPLLKDSAFKQYLAYGSDDVIRKAQIQEAYGFEDILTVPNLDTYSPANEYLVGWINHLYAMLVATSPIMPTPDVRALMTRYDIVVHPQIGLTLEYRRFGDTTLDQTKEIVECSYGANKGVASSLARITSQ